MSASLLVICLPVCTSDVCTVVCVLSKGDKELLNIREALHCE